MTQEQVLKSLMDRRVWNTFRGVLTREDFDEELLGVFDTIDKIFVEFAHKEEIKLKDLRVYLPGDNSVRTVYHQEIPDDEKILIANINKYITRNRILGILRQCAEDYQKGSLDTSQLDAIASGILELQRKLPGRDRGVSLTRINIADIFERKDSLKKLITPSDHLTGLLDGGLVAGDIMTVVAPTDGGKTMYLVNTARANVELGKKLIYVTLQTSLEETLVRFYCSAFNKDYNWMAGHVEKTGKYLEYIKTIGGEIRFVDGTNRELSVSEIDAIASDFANETGASVDGIIVDYGDLLVSSKRYQSPREEMKVVWRELNTLSVNIAAPIVTATQANRAGNIAGTVELIHVAESWAKATDSSVVVAILRDSADKIRNRATLRIVKTKKTGGYKAVDVLFDPVRCRIE